MYNEIKKIPKNYLKNIEFDIERRQKMKKVFLSHSSKDKTKVRKIANFLKENGIYVWVDEAEIRIGDSLLKKISDGILEVDYLFACISNNSINSEWVNKELEMSMNLEIQRKELIVVPILLEDCDIPVFLKNKLYADMRTKLSYQHGYDLMLRRLGVLKPPKSYKKMFTSRELTVIDFIERYNSLELNSDKLLLLQSISNEGQVFWFEAFLEFYNNVLLNIDTTPKQIYITALKILEITVQNADNEIISRIKELINIPQLIRCGDSTTIPIAISILSILNYYNDEILEILLNTIRTHTNYDCRSEIIKYFCTIIKEYRYSSDSDILVFSEKVFNIVQLNRSLFDEEELIAILISNWTSDNNLKIVLDIYYHENISVKKSIIKGFTTHKYGTLIRDPKLKNQFYSLLDDIPLWDDEKLVGNFLAYAMSEKTEVFDYEQIYNVLFIQNGFVLEYFLDCLSLYDTLYMSDLEKEILIGKIVQLIKRSDNPRKKHMVQNILFGFYDDYEIDDIFEQYGGFHNWVEEQLRLYE